MIKAITIDFWNTIFDSSGGTVRNDLRRNALLAAIEKHGIRVEADEFDVALKASWEYFNDIWRNEMRTPNVVDSVSFFWNYLKLPKDDFAVQALANYFAESVILHPPKLIDGVAAQLAELSQIYKIGLISDTGFSPGTVLKRLLEKVGILSYFTAFSFSDETGVSKPHPKAYLKVLEELNISPEEAMHIGDIEATDIVGAKQLGMKAIRFNGDPTAVYSKENTSSTLADAEMNHWQELSNILRSL